MSIVEELEADLLAFYEVHDPSKASMRHVHQLMREHPPEHVAVSLAAKYGAAALWQAAPSWAMVAEAAAPEPGAADAAVAAIGGPNAMLGLALLLLLLGGAWLAR